MSEAVSGVVLAAHLDVTPTTVAALAAKGRVVRVARGQYDLQASTRAYISHLRQVAAGRPSQNDELKAEKKRFATAQADLKEMERDAKAEVMVDVQEFSDAWDREIFMLRQRVLGMADKIAEAHPHFTRHEVLSIDGVIRAEMDQVADDAEGQLEAIKKREEQANKHARRPRRR